MKNRFLQRLGAFGAALVLMLGGTFVVSSPAQASAEVCGSASGVGGYVCTHVNGGGLWVNWVEAVYARSAPPQICDTSAWVYSIEPDGKVRGLGFQQRYGCVYFRAWFRFNLNRNFPHGTRIHTKFMQGGNRVGEEPAVRITR